MRFTRTSFILVMLWCDIEPQILIDSDNAKFRNLRDTLDFILEFLMCFCTLFNYVPNPSPEPSLLWYLLQFPGRGVKIDPYKEGNGSKRSHRSFPLQFIDQDLNTEIFSNPMNSIVIGWCNQSVNIRLATVSPRTIGNEYLDLERWGDIFIVYIVYGSLETSLKQ